MVFGLGLNEFLGLGLINKPDFIRSNRLNDYL